MTCSPIILPAMQLVCNLVAVGTSGNSGAHQSRLQHQHLPAGYNLYYEVTMYKFYDELVTWLEAKERCTRDGAQLAVIDSNQKLEYVKSRILPTQESWGLSRFPQSVHAGIIRMDRTWVNVNTGLPVLSIPWFQNGNIPKNFDCAVASADFSGLIDENCTKKTNFICELPIPANSTNLVVN